MAVDNFTATKGIRRLVRSAHGVRVTKWGLVEAEGTELGTMTRTEVLPPGGCRATYVPPLVQVEIRRYARRWCKVHNEVFPALTEYADKLEGARDESRR